MDSIYWNALSKREASDNTDELHSTHFICHYRTEQYTKTYCFTWTITNFEKQISEYPQQLCINDIEDLYFKITMIVDKTEEKLTFYTYDVIHSTTFCNYRVCILTSTEEEAIRMDWTKQVITENLKLYEISIMTLRSNKNQYLPNNTFTVRFEFEILENIIHKYISEKWVESQMSAADLITLDEPLSDKFYSSSVIFVIGNEEPISVSKYLLCLKSKVFRTMFTSNLQENISNTIEIKDINYNIFQHVIHHVETGGLSDLNVDTGDDYIDTIYDIFIAANKYEIEDLMLKCEKRLIQCTKKDNVLSHLNIAHLHNGKYLKSFAKRFIKLYLDDIKDFEDFKVLLNRHPELLDEIMKQELFTKDALYE